MADKKISQLTAASTPLAGTEVLPIVQSGSTVKVSAADVTAGRQVSAAGLTVTSSTVPANGMYLPATNTIGFSTNSIARARLNASGEFAIGNIATPRAELDVAHSDTSGSVTRSIHLGYSGANFYGYRVSNTNNAGATYAGTFAIQRGEGTQWTDNFTISDVGNVTINTGNLGIGTAPGLPLDVTGANAKIRLQPATGTNDAQSRIQNTGGIFTRGVDDSTGSGFGAGAYAGVLWHSGARNMVFGTSDVQRARIPSVGGFVVGTAALATTATDGFLYVPTCAGTPTGVPTAQTGAAPIVINTTNNKLYFYSGGAWRDAGP